VERALKDEIAKVRHVDESRSVARWLILSLPSALHIVAGWAHGSA
jgi:hypothetical protein